jgi:hypothetical protein
MKLRDYKSLLTLDQRTAMLFDLTERFPRGPTSKLRAPDYKNADGELLSEGWGSSECPFLFTGVSTAEGSNKTGGWSPYDIYELPDSEWQAQSLLGHLETPEDMAMGEGYYSGEGQARLFKGGAQLTRRSKRFAERVRRAKQWVQDNIGTAVYAVHLGGYGEDNTVYVHADNEEGAKKQWELFMEGAFTKHCDNYRADRVQVMYVRPAKTPLELMSLNEKLQKNYRAAVKQKKASVEKMLLEIEAMDMAEQVVNIYAINMVATWGTGEEDTADA